MNKRTHLKTLQRLGIVVILIVFSIIWYTHKLRGNSVTNRTLRVQQDLVPVVEVPVNENIPEWSNAVDSNVDKVFKDIADLQNMQSDASQDLISRIKLSCKDKVCSEFLTKQDYPHFNYCIKKTWNVKRHAEPVTSKCIFINGTNRNPTALASYPGSGNTWVRGLLQEVTGLCTGAIYCDVVLRQNGFPGECIRSGVVLVVKTHHTQPRWTGVHYDKSAPFTYFKKVEHIPVYGSAVFIMRNPFHAMVAEYKRQLREDRPDMHVNDVSESHFRENKHWQEFVSREVRVWQETIIAWLTTNHHHPLLVVKYEDLKEDTHKELKQVLDFLQVPYSLSRLREVVTKGYNKYKRTHTQVFDPYTGEQRSLVHTAIQRMSSVLSDHGILHMANVLEYLH